MEMVLAVLASTVFLGFLGSVDLWGKREQRASAEALDTVDQGHWLVAQIQGRPRLEKPPLPRWIVATLVTATGRRDEAIVRLPSVLAALGMVALVYALGCRLGGRAVGLSSGLALTSLGFFIVELRQAGNDGLLAFFTTLALYAAWRRLHGEGTAHDGAPGGARAWNLLFYAALGLGFLCKGPIVLLLGALTIVPYLAVAGRLREGVTRLIDGWGLALFVVLALSWPVPVLLRDPNAARIWSLEMGQKAGMAGISHFRHHHILAAEWPWITAPWVIVATLAVLLPFVSKGREYRPGIWFPWFWAVGNLAMFCLWSVAKPNYYLPCLPGAALLVGLEWVRLTREARASGAGSILARQILQGHWVALFVAAIVAPVVAHQAMPQFFDWVCVGSIATVLAVVASALAWRRGAEAGVLTPLVAAGAVTILIAYGAVAPALNPSRSHRQLAATLDHLLPADARTVMFFQELDEGLWFYLRDRAIAPVPGTQPRYNKGFDLIDGHRSGQLEPDPRKRLEAERQRLVEWLARPDRESSYVLIRKKLYEPFAAALAEVATPVYSEQGLNRNELVLLRANSPLPVATRPDAPSRR
jgi:4-amino-4-deoxy-L-arabinose transferase-like glycosyltransferase